ncbi:hypothetical protein N8266_04055 [Amylibacter sp.]|nr:hypothetical protein [Amylibacter sp.]
MASSDLFENIIKFSAKNTIPSSKLMAAEVKHLSKLEAISDNLRRGKNVQNYKLLIWLTDNE